MEFICLYAIFGNRYYKNGLQIIDAITCEVTDKVKYIIIQNDFNSRLENDDENHVHIYSDNTYSEFSAWEAGLKYAKKEFASITGETYFIVANDSFFRNYDYFCIKKNKLIKVKNKYFVMGWVDSFKNSIKLNNQNFKEWVRTNFFITNYKTLIKIESFIFYVDVVKKVVADDFFFSNYSYFFDVTHLQFVKSWLTKGKYPSNLSIPHYWYKAQEIQPNNMNEMKRKAIAILNEHLLSYNFKMNKIKVIKVNSKISKLSRIFKRFDYAIFPNENIDNTYIRNLKTSLKINGKKVVTYKKFLFYFIFNYQSIIINWYDKYSLSRLFFILLAKYIFGVKIIKILHNKQPHDRKKNKLDYFTNKYSDMIILMSHDSEKHLYEYNKKALHLFHPNYIDDFQFFKKTKSVKLRILVFGLIRPYKGIDQIIEVFKNVDAIEVTIAGKSIDNDYLSLIKTMISECNNISLIPRSLNNLEVSSIFSNTDILLLNYDISSFLISGTAILAFSLKTPVLTKRLGMFNDDTFNDACYFFEDNIDLINMTKKLVYEKDMLELKGKNGYDIVKFNTWNNFALMLINETKNRFK